MRGRRSIPAASRAPRRRSGRRCATPSACSGSLASALGPWGPRSGLRRRRSATASPIASGAAAAARASVGNGRSGWPSTACRQAALCQPPTSTPNRSIEFTKGTVCSYYRPSGSMGLLLLQRHRAGRVVGPVSLGQPPRRRGDLLTRICPF